MNLANSNKVVKNKAMGTPYRVYCIQPSLASSNMLVGREEELYTHLRGAFSKGYGCKDSDNFDKSYQKMEFFL